MVMLLALGAMSVGWMAIVALGVVVAADPSAIPELTPAM